MVDYLNNVRNRFLSVFFRSYMMMTEAMEGTSAETEGRRKFLAVSLVSSFKFAGFPLLWSMSFLLSAVSPARRLNPSGNVRKYIGVFRTRTKAIEWQVFSPGFLAVA